MADHRTDFVSTSACEGSFGSWLKGTFRWCPKTTGWFPGLELDMLAMKTYRQNVSPVVDVHQHIQYFSWVGRAGRIRAMIHSTTVIGVMRGGQVAVGADGQVTLGDQGVAIKHTAKKVRRIGPGGNVIAGFAGSVADAQALTERFEKKLEQYSGNVRRAAVEFAKDWRTDKILRQLNAMMIVASSDALLLVSGDGNVIEPDEGVVGIGSGGPFALAAARALLNHTSMPVEDIVSESLRIAANICVYSNDKITIETL